MSLNLSAHSAAYLEKSHSEGFGLRRSAPPSQFLAALGSAQPWQSEASPFSFCQMIHRWALASALASFAFPNLSSARWRCSSPVDVAATPSSRAYQLVVWLSLSASRWQLAFS